MQKEGRPLNIYIDQNQSGVGGTLPDQITTVLQNSRYLLPVITPLYTRSEWCELERVTFIEAYGAEEALKRVVRVDKEPVEDVAGELDDLKQYRFYYRDESKQIDLVVSKNNNPGRYYELITELALHILHDINAVSKSRDNTIYVARTSPNLSSMRNQICKEFEQRGFNVVPTSLGVLPNKAREKATIILESAFMSIHLIEDEFEPIMKNESESIDRIQFEEAANIDSDISKTYVWASAATLDDPRQQELLELAQATNVTDLLHDIHIFKEEIINAAMDHSENVKRTQEIKPKTTNVYLHYGAEDEGSEDVLVISQALTEKGFEVFEPDFEQADPHVFMEACTAILYYFGDGPTGTTYYAIKTGTDFAGECVARGIYLKKGVHLKNPTTKAIVMAASGNGSELDPFFEALGVE